MRVLLPTGLLRAQLVLTVALVTATSAWSEEPSRLDPQRSYQAERRNPVTYDVDFSVVVTPPYHTHTLKVWLPLPQTDRGQEVQEGDLTTFPMHVQPQIATESVYGNRFAYFEFSDPRGAQIIRHRFQIRVWELHWNVDPDRVQPVSEWPVEFAPYLRSEQRAVVVNDSMKNLLWRQIVPQGTRQFADFAAVMRWVDSHFTYDHVQASLAASSLHGLQRRRGHCSDYHGFCAAMGRAMGYPTRVTYGINPFPKNSPSHCKLEVFLPPYGWVCFDVSETQKLAARIAADESLTPGERDALTAAASRRLLSGFRDNTWFLQTRGTEYELAPPASRRVSVVRTIYAEADGEPLPEPDPSAEGQREFSWMTVHDYESDRDVTYPYRDWSSLAAELSDD